MYVVKKTQYLFYKHALLHGLNICVGLWHDNDSLVTSETFTTYWMLLNTSYVMEFFLQTLVKKRMLSQGLMLVLQCMLMCASGWAVVKMFARVGSGGGDWRMILVVSVSGASVVLNFIRRGHEVTNVMAVTTMAHAAVMVMQ